MFSLALESMQASVKSKLGSELEALFQEVIDYRDKNLEDVNFDSKRNAICTYFQKNVAKRMMDIVWNLSYIIAVVAVMFTLNVRLALMFVRVMPAGCPREPPPARPGLAPCCRARLVFWHEACFSCRDGPEQRQQAGASCSSARLSPLPAPCRAGPCRRAARRSTSPLRKALPCRTHSSARTNSTSF